METPTSTHSRLPLPRRVVTEPPPFQPPRRSLSVSSATSQTGLLGVPKPVDESIETLYNHPSAKIIAFTSSQRFSSAGFDLLSEPKPGSLTASSHLERTIAVGPFRIYRAPGSVAFLSCGSALQPILPKSQCWCIDKANGRFVLQIRRPQYWRIEVPLTDAEDAHRALVLREVFDSILLFEKTECPFQRSFTVRLPERPQTPVKKKPWTPIGKNLISSPFLSDLSPPLPATELVNKKRRANSCIKAPETQTEVRRQEDQVFKPYAPVIGGRPETSNAPRNSDETPAARDSGTREAAKAQVLIVVEETPEDSIPLEPIRDERQSTLETLKLGTNSDVREERAPQDPGSSESHETADEHVLESEVFAIVVKDSEVTASTVIPAVTPEPRVGNPVSMQQMRQRAPEFVQYGLGNATPEMPTEAPMIQREKEVKPRTETTHVVTVVPRSDPVVPAQDSTIGTSMTVDSATAPAAFFHPAPKSPMLTKTSGTALDRDFVQPEAQQDVSTEGTSATVMSSQALAPRCQQDGRLEEPITSVQNGEHVAATDIPANIADDEPNAFEGSGSVGVVSLKKKRMSRMLAGRSVTLPPQLTLVTSPPSTSTPRLTPEQSSAALPPPLTEPPEPLVDEASPIESVDSFHSVQSWHSPITPLPPSPPSSSASPTPFPYPHENIILPVKALRTVRSANFTPTTGGTLVASSAGATVRAYDTDSPADSLSPTQHLKASSPELVQPIEPVAGATALPDRPGLQHRSRTTNLSISRRALSPLPSAANLFSPTAQRRPANRLAVVRNLPGSIINKTVEILLSPPGHLVNLMLKVAAKIAAGEWRGLVFGLGEGGESIPVHWDYSDGELSSWEDDDDYNFSIGRLTKTHSNSSGSSKEQADRQTEPSMSKAEKDRSWEVD